MREFILSSFQGLEFIEEGHRYNLHNTDGTIIEKIPSASAIIERFVPKADWEDIANRYAMKHNMDVSAVKRMWKEKNIKSTNNGSSTHLYWRVYAKIHH